MRWVLTVRAGANARFTPQAFDTQIGKTIPVHIELGQPVTVTGRVIGVQVAGDGLSARLAVELVPQEGGLT